MKRVLLLALLALGVSSVVAYAMEPDNCRKCKGVYDEDMCGRWNGQAHADGQGTILWKVIVPHSFSCDTCPNMHPTGGDECAEAIAAIENATADKRTVPSLGEGSPELVAYKPGDDHANVLCRGQVIAVIPVDEATAAASLRVAMASASGQVALP